MPRKPKKPTPLQALEAKVAALQARVEYYESTRKDFARALGELMMGTFVSPDEAAEIARDAVSERIW